MKFTGLLLTVCPLALAQAAQAPNPTEQTIVELVVSSQIIGEQMGQPVVVR